MIAAVVGGIRAVQAMVRMDPYDTALDDGPEMAMRARIEGLVNLAKEWLLAVLILVVLLGAVASYRRPSLHVSRTDMTGRVVIITQSCSGRGFLHAETLARWNAHVTVTCDREPEAKASAARIVEATGNPNVRGMLLDLRSIRSVRAFAARFAETHERLHVLVNSADAPESAATSGPALLTQDGIDSVLQVRIRARGDAVCAAVCASCLHVLSLSSTASGHRERVARCGRSTTSRMRSSRIYCCRCSRPPSPRASCTCLRRRTAKEHRRTPAPTLLLPTGPGCRAQRRPCSSAGFATTCSGVPVDTAPMPTRNSSS